MLSDKKLQRIETSQMVPGWHLVVPDASLGYAVSQLVQRCPPLDTNSIYCNLLQTHHFAKTSVAAIDNNNKLVGFISGYLIPQRPQTLFIWQVAVDPSMRKQGMALSMLKQILQREICQSVTHLETTVTDANAALQGLFAQLAKLMDAKLEQSILFEKKQHFNEVHDSEILIRIGPFISSLLSN